jgi:hypothetical protein
MNKWKKMPEIKGSLREERKSAGFLLFYSDKKY